MTVSPISIATANAAPVAGVAPLSCESLSLSFGPRRVLEDVTFELARGEVTTIVGANACGKSSLLRSLARLQLPDAGRVLLEGEDIRRQKTKEVARKLAVLPQTATAPAGLRVMDLVLKGRTPHQNPLQQWSRADEEIVQRSLFRVGLEGQGSALLQDLSGGQLQRAWIAMVLAQDTEILLLDEPTTFLDLAHQLEILKLVRKLQTDTGLTVAMVLHDINLAARFSDRIVALKDRRILCQGAPKEVVTEDNIRQVYGLNCSVICDPHHGHPHILLK